MPLADLKPFSLSRNFFEQFVTPLVNSGRLRNEPGLLEVLKKLHGSLWQTSGNPSAFSGAIAGYFQEVLDGYKFAVVKEVPVQLGSVAGYGGDSVVLRVNKIKTTQFKVTAVDVLSSVETHFAKAAWQLTGAGGEHPEPYSHRVIEVVIQGASLENATAAQWKQCIADAWENGYTDEKDRTKCRTKLDLYAAVDAVKVTTRTHRWTFPVTRTAAGWVVGDGTRKDPKLDRGNVLTNGKLNQHWLWLATWVRAEQKKYKTSATIMYGCGSGRPETPVALPFQTVEIRPLFSEDD